MRRHQGWHRGSHPHLGAAETRESQRARRYEAEEEEAAEAEEEEEGGGIAACLNHLNIETGAAEEETAGGLSKALGMEGVEDEGSEGEEGGGGTLRALEALEFLTQKSEPSGTTLVDARNGFNELSRLAMLWSVRHCWPAGARFAFNCYKHWTQLLLRHLGELPVKILSREGVTQGDPLSIVLYGITRMLEEKLCPMLVAIERKSCSSRPAVTYSPQHCQAAHLVEAIAGIN